MVREALEDLKTALGLRRCTRRYRPITPFAGPLEACGGALPDGAWSSTEQNLPGGHCSPGRMRYTIPGLALRRRGPGNHRCHCPTKARGETTTAMLSAIAASLSFRAIEGCIARRAILARREHTRQMLVSMRRRLARGATTPHARSLRSSARLSEGVGSPRVVVIVQPPHASRRTVNGTIIRPPHGARVRARGDATRC
jgi:hypothetical protein